MTSSVTHIRRPIPPRPHALDPDVLLTVAGPGWDQARSAWNLSVDQQPAAIGMPRTTEEVLALVRFASDRGLRVAPQATGHGAACLGSLEDSLLLRTSKMRSARVDPRSRTAWAQAGAIWMDVTALAGGHGLAALAGSAPDVGVIGYMLGGGLSWLGRRYGLAANSIARAEVVTGDGRRLDVDADQEPELFWALRGGGGSYGVVTALEFDLYPVSAVYAGAMFWPLQRAGEVLEAWTHWLAQVPDEVTSVGRLLRIPPMPGLPPTLSGRNLVAIEASFIGSADSGRHLLAPLRALGPEIDTFMLMPSHALGNLHMDPPNPVPFYGDGMLLSELPAAALDNLLDVAGPYARSPLLCIDVRQLGGALGQEPSGGGAVSWLDAQFAMFAVAMTPDQAARELAEAHIEGLQQALGRWQAPRAFANLAERPRLAADLFGERTAARLACVKRAYDPSDVIRANHPVAPADTWR
jgi:hypothetical protein